MIAIHNSQVGFHGRWIKYCEQQSIPYKLVDCYATDIVRQLEGCAALMWHHNHALPTDKLMAQPLLHALYHAGIPIFPNFHAHWHFDDKLAQKYLLEALGVDFVQTDVFFDKRQALDWLDQQTFPKVFKLRGGAGSKNVRLVKDLRAAKKLVQQAFGRGFRPVDPWSTLKDIYQKYWVKKASLTDLLKAVAHLVYPYQVEKTVGRERGYVYFQEFIPDNTYDIRVITVNEKAAAVRRPVREGDFRASGSGFLDYGRELIPEELVDKSFRYAELLKSGSVAFDYVIKGNTHLLVEISYGFTAPGYDPCPGYWSRDLSWHEEPFDPCAWMVDYVLKITQE